mmetsp:Transcript_11512/g.36771  ORF Transcript_11512/g.36771 Transcript_11512/m.36771 type:complete len:115 (-) Transcript_11512:236-580(-)
MASSVWLWIMAAGPETCSWHIKRAVPLGNETSVRAQEILRIIAVGFSRILRCRWARYPAAVSLTATMPAAVEYIATVLVATQGRIEMPQGRDRLLACLCTPSMPAIANACHLGT